VSGSGSGRVSVAGLVATKPGQKPRLIYRTRRHHGRKDEPKGFAEADYIALLDAAHQYLGGPIVVVWDNLNTHRSAVMKDMVKARSWLTMFMLPPYAPELNPVEGVWSHLKRSLVDLTKHTVDQLAVVVKSRLKRMQYRPELVQGFIAKTELDFALPS
jgi:hypothetical protein